MPYEQSTQIPTGNLQSLHQPSYKYLKKAPTDGNTYTFSTSQGLKEIRLPNVVYNLKRSYLEFDLLFAAAPANNANHFHVLPPFKSLKLTNSAGFEIVPDMANFQAYWKTVCRASISQQEFMTKDPLTPNTTVATSFTGTDFQAPSKDLALGAHTALVGDSMYVRNGGTLTGIAVPDADQGAISLYDSPVHVITSGLNAAMGFRCRLYLKHIADSFFSLDQDLYFNDMLTLSLVMSESNRMGSTSIGGTAVTDIEIGPPVAFVAEPVMSNLSIQLAVEKNVDIQAQVMDLFSKGQLKYVVPQPLQWFDTIGTSTSFSASHQLNVSHGKTLLRVYSVPLLSTNSVRFAWNIENVNGVKHTSIRTGINGQFLQDESVSFTNSEAWKQQEANFAGSALSGERSHAIHGSLWCDNIANAGTPSYKWSETNSKLSGIELSGEPLLYTQDIVKPATSTILLTWPIVQKVLKVSPSGCAWE